MNKGGRKKALTIGEYLIKRLEQVGVRHVFGVPGDYVLEFLNYLEINNIKVIYGCDELNSGYAADAYARLNGVSAVCVTYGVGGFSLFNAIAGAYAENVPVIVISGGYPVLKKQKKQPFANAFAAPKLQSNIYKNITAASIVLSPKNAMQQIDEAIQSCMQTKKPIYIEIPQDIVSKPLKSPKTQPASTVAKSDTETLNEAVAEAVELLLEAEKPLIFAGVEIHRFGIQNELKNLLAHTGYLFVTTALSKSIVSEQHPQFVGVYAGERGNPLANQMVEESDLILGLGVIAIGIGIRSARLDDIEAHAFTVRIKDKFYHQVRLKDFIHELLIKLPKEQNKREFIRPATEAVEKFVVHSGNKIKKERFFKCINSFLNNRHIVIADSLDPLFKALQLFLPEDTFFISQAFYLSLGFSVPATLGVGLAVPEKRPVLFVGDNAFHLTVQVISIIARQEISPIVFLITETSSVIEAYFSEKEESNLPEWKYCQLPEVFHSKNSWGCLVRTEGELEEALAKATKKEKELAFIEIQLSKNS